jgi:hypothetical protein
MKISVKTQYLCVQNVFIMLGLRLGKGGNKSRQQDGMCSLNLKNPQPWVFFSLWDDDNGKDGNSRVDQLQHLLKNLD